jgi:TolB-like protein
LTTVKLDLTSANPEQTAAAEVVAEEVVAASAAAEEAEVVAEEDSVVAVVGLVATVDAAGAEGSATVVAEGVVEAEEVVVEATLAGAPGPKSMAVWSSLLGLRKSSNSCYTLPFIRLVSLFFFLSIAASHNGPSPHLSSGLP